MNRCADPHCGRWVRAGEAICQRHRGDDEGDAVDDREWEERGGHAAFRAQLAAGDYEALLGPGLREVLHQAAGAGLESEIGSLRVAMTRLLQEEGDPSRMASGVARVAGVLVQAARLRQSGDATGEEFHDTMQRELAAIDKEVAGIRAGRNDDAEDGR